MKPARRRERPAPFSGLHRESLRYDQDDFDEFARLSGDDNPIHVDPDYAASTRFGATVAHGMLLFSSLTAAASRLLDEPVEVLYQDLVFPSPTYADLDHTVELAVHGVGEDVVEIEQTITDPDETVTAQGRAVLGLSALASAPEPPPPAESSDQSEPATRMGSLVLGQIAGTTRVFTVPVVREWCALVDDPNPRFGGPEPEVPEPLIGGLISQVLGVELPGPGTSWLKQRFRFGRSVIAGAEVGGRVAVTRLRPEKHLVDLRTTCEVGGSIVLDGRALVLASHL